MSKALIEANKKVKDACDKAKAKWEANKANVAINNMSSNSKSSWEAIYEIKGGTGGHHKKPTRMAMKMADGNKNQK